MLIKVGACVASTLEEMEWNAQGKGITIDAEPIGYPARKREDLA